MVETRLEPISLERAIELLISKDEGINSKVYFHNFVGDYLRANDHRWVFGDNDDSYALRILKADFYEQVEVD